MGFYASGGRSGGKSCTSEPSKGKKGTMKRLTTFSVAIGLGACLFQGQLYAGLSAEDNNASGAGARPLVDYSSAIVQLKMDPLTTFVKTKPGPGKKIDFS